MVTPGLIKKILANYPLALDGCHGPSHWARVYQNGMRLAELTGANIDVVAIFAVLHDCRRTTEGTNYYHGKNAADYAYTLRSTVLSLENTDFRLLYDACAGHAEGKIEADITIQTCWDADRLDLPRVGLTINPELLCTDAARDPDMIAWATQRACDKFRPPILEEWLAEHSDS